jgi:hypothetical protein
MKASQAAKKTHPILKWTRLIQDMLNWRLGDVTSTELEEEMSGSPIDIARHAAINSMKKESLTKYVVALSKLLAPYDPDAENDDLDDEEVVKSAKEDRIAQDQSDRDKLNRIVAGSSRMGRQEIGGRLDSQKREDETIENEKKSVWQSQTLLHNAMPCEELKDVLEVTWEDPRRDN